MCSYIDLLMKLELVTHAKVNCTTYDVTAIIQQT